MAWVSTNKDIATKIVINKTALGQPLLGYPKTYNLLAAFDTYPAITVKQWQEMGVVPLTERIEDFIAYINALEVVDIVEIQTNQALRFSTKIRMLGSGGMLMNNNNLRISI
jgi:hypothetical protein